MKSASHSYRVSLLPVAFLVSGILVSSKASAVIKVSCVGASNFSGDGSSTGHHVPDELGIALGSNYVVKNLGVSGTTVLFKGDFPYWNGLAGDGPHLKPALDSAPDVAIFWFGGNDAKAQNWTTHKNEFVPNYEQFLRRFQALPSKPKLFIFKSMVIHDVEGIPKTVLEMEVLPKIDTIAADTGAFVVPYHDAFIIHPELFPDGVHPSNAGSLAIGKFLADIVIKAMNPTPTPDAGSPMDGGAAGVSGTGAAGSGAAGSGARARGPRARALERRAPRAPAVPPALERQAPRAPAATAVRERQAPRAPAATAARAPPARPSPEAAALARRSRPQASRPGPATPAARSPRERLAPRRRACRSSWRRCSRRVPGADAARIRMAAPGRGSEDAS